MPGLLPPSGAYVYNDVLLFYNFCDFYRNSAVTQHLQIFENLKNSHIQTSGPVSRILNAILRLLLPKSLPRIFRPVQRGGISIAPTNL
jgi:NADPH-dependent 7-cyano-7-deazaguanine reductase QueF